MDTTGRRSRTRLTALLAAGLLAASMVTAAASADEPATDWGDRDKEVVDGELAAPTTPNPFLALLPTAANDIAAWTTYAAHRSAADAAAPPRGPRSPAVRERPGDNDRIQGAQPVFLTTGRDGAGGIDVIGRAPAATAGTSTDAGFATEGNGSIPDAQVLPVLTPGDEVTGEGVIGDEDAFDFDFFALPGLTAGDTITVDVDTPLPFADLDSFVALWDDSGAPFPIVATNDDDGVSFDSRLQVQIPADGTYYVSVGGFGAFVPADPYDSSSPSDTGAVGSQGEYAYTISSFTPDVDHYKFRLAAGDVVGATVIDGASLALYGTDDELLMGSSQDVTFVHPAASPLPGGGNASLSYVIDEAGTYTLAVTTTEDYVAQLRAFRPFGDVPGRASQVLFLDFDGGEVDPGIFGGGPLGFEVSLSPLSSFLPAWGLGPGDEDAVIDAIVASVVENLEEDIADLGENPAYDIEILNSRDHAEPTGPLVSNIIVGGTIPELGIGTVGIAQSIDVGNFETEETAVVLLDLLSGTGPFPVPDVDLNNYPLAPGTSIIDLVGTAVGNITAHEAGHFFANWHTDQFNAAENIMDQGGNLPGTIGVGPDGVFGSDDDVDVDFGEDVFVPNEGFTGLEDTLTSIGFGLWADGG